VKQITNETPQTEGFIDVLKRPRNSPMSIIINTVVFRTILQALMYICSWCDKTNRIKNQHKVRAKPPDIVDTTLQSFVLKSNHISLDANVTLSLKIICIQTGEWGTGAVAARELPEQSKFCGGSH